MNLVLMGPPGSGKGTQARRVASARGVPIVATGDILRRTALASTPIGREAKAAIERGELVDDEMIIDILSALIIAADARKGFVLDGFPRTVNQGLALDVLMEDRGPVIVVEIAVPHDELLRRVSRRLVCQACGMNADLVAGSTRQCHCGGPIRMRPDDNEVVAHERLRIYERATKPLVDFYRKRQTFRSVDGALPPERVTGQIEHAVDMVLDNLPV
jgi:adenylate kinase